MYTKQVWVDDDGSGTTGTIFNAARMNNIERGVEQADRAVQRICQQGVFEPTGYKVTTNSNLAPSVAAGTALVGDSTTGLLLAASRASTGTVTIGTAHATLPRLDQIVLSSAGAVSVVAGTATSGATLDNRTGAAALPSNSIRLADVLVGAAMTNIPAANIRDRRPWATGAFAIGTSSPNTSSTSATGASIDATNAKHRVEVSGNWPVRVKQIVNFYVQGTLQALIWGLKVNGSATQVDYQTPPQTNYYQKGNWETILNPAAGSHLYESIVQNATNTTQTFFWGYLPQIFTVEELVGHASANNGTS